MNKTNLKKLFENWRGYVSESGQRKPFLCLWALEDELVIYDGFELYKYLNTVIKRKMEDAVGPSGVKLQKHKFEEVVDLVSLIYKTDIVIGSIRLGDSNLLKTKCYGSYEVYASAVHPEQQGFGMGSLLYGLALTHIYPKPLMPDRGSVSPSAGNVWRGLGNKPGVETVPPDEEPYKGKFDNVRNPKTKPKDDDCEIHNDPNNPALDKGYKLDSSKFKSKYKKMISNHQKTMDTIRKLDFIEPPTDGDFSDMRTDLFSYTYEEDEYG